MSSHPPAIRSHDCALFLDIDGTLLELEEHPTDVVADDEIMSLLISLQTDMDAALALVTGRSIEDVDRMFAPHQFPVAGEHGATIRWPDGSVMNKQHNSLPDDVVQNASEFVASREGLYLENKSVGIALHFRQAPAMEEDCRRFVESAQSELGDGVRILEGKMVFELTPRGTNKGVAVASMLSRAPYQNRVPIFVGDDVTDEDGFDSVNRAGGVSVRVGEIDRSSARYLLADVSAVREWLEDSVKVVME